MIESLSTEFKLEPEEDVTAFLGIQFRKHASGTLELIQPHLINQIIETVFGNQEFHAKATPTTGMPLLANEDGESCL